MKCSFLTQEESWLVKKSQGLCDGACMAQANTMTEMLTLAGIGLAFFVCGGALLVSNHREVA